MKNTISVSIITPLYNSEQFIKDTILSIINQSFKYWEMLIIDDNSSDDSVNIVKEYVLKDHRIKLYKNEFEKGPAGARNFGIKKAQGEYIAFLDSDDIWLPEKLSKQILFMRKNSAYFTFTSYQQINESGELLDKIISVPESLTYKQALLKNPIGCLTVVYNSKKLGKIYMPNLEKRQDYGLWLKILRDYTMGIGIDDVLALYRVRENSISSNKIKLIKHQWILYRKELKLNILQSVFYIFCVIIQKILNIK